MNYHIILYFENGIETHCKMVYNDFSLMIPDNFVTENAVELVDRLGGIWNEIFCKDV